MRRVLAIHLSGIANFKCLLSSKQIHIDYQRWMDFEAKLDGELSSSIKDIQGYSPLFIALIGWPYSSFIRHLLNLSSANRRPRDNNEKTIPHSTICNQQLVKLIIKNQCL